MLLRIHVFSPFACGKEKGSMNPLFCQIRKFLWDICKFEHKKRDLRLVNPWIFDGRGLKNKTNKISVMRDF